MANTKLFTPAEKQLAEAAGAVSVMLRAQLGSEDPETMMSAAYLIGMVVAHYHPEYAARVVQVLRDGGMNPLPRMTFQELANLIVEKLPLEGEL